MASCAAHALCLFIAYLFNDPLVAFLALTLSLTFLQSINVLCVHSEKQAFVMKHADEVVYVVGPVAARIQHLGQREEGLRVIGEVVDVENGFWVRDVVLLQVGIETCAWSSEEDRRKHFDIHFGHFWRRLNVSSEALNQGRGPIHLLLESF